MPTKVHALTGREGICACGWSSRGRTLARRKSGLTRHLVAARARGELMQTQVEVTSDFSEYDDSRADTPTGAYLIQRLISAVFFTGAYWFVDLFGVIALSWFALQYARVHISGWFFAVVSLVAVVVIALIINAAIVKVTSRVVQVVFGPPLMGPGSMSKAQLQLAIRAAQSYHVNFRADDDRVVRRLVDIDERVTQAAVDAGDDWALAFVNVRDPKTGVTIAEISEDGNLKVAQSGTHFLFVGFLASRLSAVAFTVLAVLAVLEADGSIERVTLVQIATGLVLLVGVIVMSILSFRFAVSEIMNPDYSRTSPAAAEAVTEEDTEFLDAVSGRFLYPRVKVDPGFYGVLRHYVVRLHAPLMLVNLASVAVFFVVAAFVAWVWPGQFDDWMGPLTGAFRSLVIVAVAYLVGLWVALTAVPRARALLKPIAVAMLTGVGTVFVMYLASGTFEVDASLSAVAAAMPVALVSGVVAAFFRDDS